MGRPLHDHPRRDPPPSHRLEPASRLKGAMPMLSPCPCSAIAPVPATNPGSTRNHNFARPIPGERIPSTRPAGPARGWVANKKPGRTDGTSQVSHPRARASDQAGSLRQGDATYGVNDSRCAPRRMRGKQAVRESYRANVQHQPTRRLRALIGMEKRHGTDSREG